MVILTPIEGESIHGVMVGVDDLGNLILKDDEGVEKAYPIGDLKLRRSA
jgi:small nuclear ribonucleoprotein (snRNP)-like protein